MVHKQVDQLKVKIKNAAFNYLIDNAKKHSKALKIQYDKLIIQDYLTDKRFSSEEKMYMEDVKLNFSSMYSDLTCDLCNDGILQDTPHLLFCRTLLDNCPELYNDTEVEYSQIFNGTDDQLIATRLFYKVFKTKKRLSEQQ